MTIDASGELEIGFDGVKFTLKWPGQENDFAITSELELSTASAEYTFDAVPLGRRALKESLILEVKLKRASKQPERVGWVIPANALDSRSHDFVAREYFLRYAYVTIREILTKHQELFLDNILEMSKRGVTEVSFSELFHDNVCFLIVCRELAAPNSDFELSRLLPSLISLGFIPLDVVDPAFIEWTCGDAEDGPRAIILRPVSENLMSPALPGKLVSIAAGTRGSVVTQFFYFYQVIEYLLEEVLHGLLQTMGQRISESLDSADFLSLRDHLEGLGTRLSEKDRLQIVVRAARLSVADLDDLVAASNNFLRAVSQTEREGIGALYQVRNYIVHQVRNMPEGSESTLNAVVMALACFLPNVLHSFERPTSS